VLVEVFSLLFPSTQSLQRLRYYGQQFALFFLLAAWLGFMSQFILIGAVYNKLRLAFRSTRDRGLAGGEQPRAQDPHSVIEAHRARSATAGRRAASGADAGKMPPATTEPGDNPTSRDSKGPPPKAGGGLSHEGKGAFCRSAAPYDLLRPFTTTRRSRRMSRGDE